MGGSLLCIMTWLSSIPLNSTEVYIQVGRLLKYGLLSGCGALRPLWGGQGMVGLATAAVWAEHVTPTLAATGKTVKAWITLHAWLGWGATAATLSVDCLQATYLGWGATTTTTLSIDCHQATCLG